MNIINYITYNNAVIVVTLKVYWLLAHHKCDVWMLIFNVLFSTHILIVIILNTYFTTKDYHLWRQNIILYHILFHTQSIYITHLFLHTNLLLHHWWVLPDIIGNEFNEGWMKIILNSFLYCDQSRMTSELYCVQVCWHKLVLIH